MPVFRINKNKNYTVMSNHHLREKGMSLKAKGLLSLILSLPEDWDYSVEGLATLSKDGRDAVSSAIKELERFGYIRRTQSKDGRGFFSGYDYEVFEEPVPIEEEDGAPSTGFPSTDNPQQINKDSTKYVSDQDKHDRSDRDKATPSDPLESLKKILRESPEAMAWVNENIEEAVDSDIRARLSRLDAEDAHETKPSAFTRRLVSSGYIRQGDLEIGDYNRFFADLVHECGDWTLVKNAVNYFAKTCRGEMRDGITNRLAYAKEAIAQGVRTQIHRAEVAERMEAFEERMRKMTREGVQS